MRRWILLIPLLLLACQATAAIFTPVQPSPEQTQAPEATATRTPAPTASPTRIPTRTATPSPPASEGFTVRYHPDGPLFAGDRVSIEVIAPEDYDTEEAQVQVEMVADPPQDLGRAEFASYGIGRRSQATLTWIWDTAGLEAGEYKLSFEVIPDGPDWVERVSLQPAVDIPSPEPRARWKTAETNCCIIHYITGTDAARDISEILEIADEEARAVAEQMGVGFEDPIPITLLPRVVGHGGFAGDEIYVSYLDRNYAGNDLAQVLHHEMVHLLDGRLSGELRPAILVEGLAVYLSGGHFKKEAIFPRAAALVELGWYLPLGPLTDEFYTAQHEAGYLEGAALVEYLVTAYGWETFEAFYRDIHPHPSGKPSKALDAALRVHFNLTLEELEQRFKTELDRGQITAEELDDLRLSIAFYDTVRRYQQALDPSAYFLTAWLPNGEEMRERGIVADYLRRPGTQENQSIENLLVETDRHLRAGDYFMVEMTLEQIDQQLDLRVPVEASFISLVDDPVVWTLFIISMVVIGLQATLTEGLNQRCL